jgi:hypothetical protein
VAERALSDELRRRGLLHPGVDWSEAGAGTEGRGGGGGGGEAGDSGGGGGYGGGGGGGGTKDPAAAVLSRQCHVASKAILPADAAASPVLLPLMRELLASSVLGPLLGFFSPRWVYRGLANVLAPPETSSSSAAPANAPAPTPAPTPAPAAATTAAASLTAAAAAAAAAAPAAAATAVAAAAAAPVPTTATTLTSTSTSTSAIDVIDITSFLAAAPSSSATATAATPVSSLTRDQMQSLIKRATDQEERVAQAIYQRTVHRRSVSVDHSMLASYMMGSTSSLVDDKSPPGPSIAASDVDDEGFETMIRATDDSEVGLVAGGEAAEARRALSLSTGDVSTSTSGHTRSYSSIAVGSESGSRKVTGLEGVIPRLNARVVEVQIVGKGVAAYAVGACRLTLD